MLIALIAAACMVVANVLSTCMVMAEAANRGWLAGWLYTAGWYVGIATTTISVTALQGHDMTTKVLVLVLVGAANLLGTKLGQVTGHWLLTRSSSHREPITESAVSPAWAEALATKQARRKTDSAATLGVTRKCE